MRELNVGLGEKLDKVFSTTEVTINYNGARIYPSGTFKLTDVNNVIQKNLQENYIKYHTAINLLISLRHCHFSF